jgi:SOS response regulatory protein OraA/RecX
MPPHGEPPPSALRAADRRALDVAVAALARRGLSEHALRQRLRRAGIAPEHESEAIETLLRLGYLDDVRLACDRAVALAERGYGDAVLEVRLSADGLDCECVRAALEILEPEEERARRLVARERPRRSPSSLARLLARRGFGVDAIESALADERQHGEMDLDGPAAGSLP